MTPIKAGAYRLDITPPLGTGLAGSFEPRAAAEIWDPLYVNALVLNDEQREIAILSVDVCRVPIGLVREACKGIEQHAGIPAENVIISATHTHNGPITGGKYTDYSIPQDYLKVLEKQLVTAVRMAKRRIQPVTIGVGKGRDDRFIYNRRLKAPDGSIRMNWISPSLLENCVSEGNVDPELIAIKFADLRNNPIALIVNVSNHNNAVNGGNVISADYAGYMGKLLRDVYGDDVIVLFMVGACGDVNWVDSSGKTPRDGLYKKIGTSLAGTVMKLESVMEYPEISRIQISRKTLQISERPYCDYDTFVDNTFGNGGKAFFEVYQKVRNQEEGKELAKYELELNCIKFGEAIAIVTNPTELFVDFGLAVKERSPIPYTLMSTMTNGYMGYVPTRKAFEEGGYEVRKIAGGSFLSVDAGEKIVESSLNLLQS